MDLREIPDSSFERHPWEVARARFFTAVVGRAGLADRALRVLDVGAGDGYVAAHLHDAMGAGTSVTCVDSNYTAEQLADFASGAGERDIVFTVTPPDDTFDLIVLLDVVEHVDDDIGFVGDLARERLHPDGHVLVSVPAWPALFTRHDIALGHYRRYTPRRLRAALAAAGLHLVIGGGVFTSLLPVRALSKLAEVGRGVRSRPDLAALADAAHTETGAWSRGPKLTAVVNRGLAIDTRLSLAASRRRIPLPGLSTWALARAPAAGR